MKRETVLALNALNRAFYAAVAPEWSETRRHAWPGFARVWELARPPSVGTPWRVLDVGAGDGRFAAFLAARLSAAGRSIAYLGLDSSAPLLATARARGLGPAYRFALADLVLDAEALSAASLRACSGAAAAREGPGGVPEPTQFDLVVLLGVLHHVPSSALRRAIVARLGQLTAPGGSFALTFWRLDRDPRFASRVRSFASFNARVERPVPERDLEPGDTLLSWGRSERAVRYCHFPDARETDALIEAAGLPVRARFFADGRGSELNEYVVFARTRP